MKLDRKYNNFDLIRVFLAIIVFIEHIDVLSQINGFLVISKIVNAGIAVDSFFVVSGFLIFMSFESSSSIKSYFLKRIKRILPAYVVVVLFCAFLFAFLSSASFGEYFNFTWIKYVFFNLLFLNFIQPTLPHVFENNFMQAINGSLWTIKIEVMFYISVPIIWIFLSRYNKIIVITLIYMGAVVYSELFSFLADKYNTKIFLILEKQLPGQLAFFISGALLYYYYNFFHKKSFIILIVAILALFLHKFFDLYVIYPIALAIVIIYFTSIFKYLGNFGKYGDLSYGIYIWHFPIIQIFIHLNLLNNFPIIGYVSLIFSVFLMAFLSWHFVEKPFLRRDSHYKLSEKL